MSSATMLSQNDRLVLGALFDAESSPKNVASTCDSTSRLPGITDEELLSLQERELSAIRPLNAENPSKEDIRATIAQLGALIAQQPRYAPAYNNRAQALSMLLGDSLFDLEVVQSSLYQDLCDAIRLASPATGHSPVSALQMSVLASAYTHRGKIILNCATRLAESDCNDKILLGLLEGTSSEDLSQMAGKEFMMGGRYGNAVAKQLAVQLNPFAKMCGQIVKEAMLADLEESRAAGLM
ncbi:hypothetical protein VTL71DRAFT_14824 [Oculimacula yallundae]|uniref:Uncharacterized protein n=1 Tax=Oculimacula yallundae TaxID=86028 RepID=A0ABR4CLV8_9HELO